MGEKEKRKAWAVVAVFLSGDTKLSSCTVEIRKRTVRYVDGDLAVLRYRSVVPVDEVRFSPSDAVDYYESELLGEIESHLLQVKARRKLISAARALLSPSNGGQDG